MNSDCSVVERAIVFTFPGAHEGYPEMIQEMCDTAAQETAHALGLDHELDCLDPMTYLGRCGTRSFLNKAVDCGEDTARACTCGGPTQNSYAILKQVLGDPEQDLLPPDLTILEPLDGSVVDPGFAIEATATDESGVERVTLFIDAVEYASGTGEPYASTRSESTMPGFARPVRMPVRSCFNFPSAFSMRSSASNNISSTLIFQSTN